MQLLATYIYSHTVYTVPFRSTASETATMPICLVVCGGCLEHSQRKTELENALLSLTDTMEDADGIRKCVGQRGWRGGRGGKVSLAMPPTLLVSSI